MDILHVAIEGTIARITLNRPDKRNALNADLLRRLRAEFRTLAADAQVKVIVLAANGKAFCAGADLEYLQDVSRYSAMENLADS
jgi:methylglutaconyl-CoA hydratase